MARKKAHLVRNILLLTASSWWTFSGAWRRWLEPWCKPGAANVKAAPESAGGPGLSGLLLGAHFGLLCNRAPAPPPWCSAARRDVLQRITERSLLLPCGWYWLWWGEMARGGALWNQIGFQNREAPPTNIGEVGNKLFRASGTNAVEMLGNISLGGRSCTNRRDRGVYSCPVPFFLQRAVWTNNNAGNSGVQAPRPLWQENARQIFVLSRGGQISKLWSPDPHFHFVPSPLPLSTLKQKLPWSFTLVSG